MCILRNVTSRASILGAAETHTGNVRDRNEDTHFIDGQRGLFAVFDGMGGNAGGEFASALAAATIASRWGHEATQGAIDAWLRLGTPTSRRSLIETVKAGVKEAHEALVAAAKADRAMQGMGTTVVGALVVGSEVMFAHCGDSRAYLVRDGQAVQLTEDHTLLQRLLSAGIDVDLENDGSRWNSVLTKAVGLDKKCDPAVFFVPVTTGDLFVLCSDGVTQYVQQDEIAGIIGQKGPPPAAAKRLVDIALARGGGDNATALVMHVVDAGAPERSAASAQRDCNAIAACPLWGTKVSAQGQLCALQMAMPETFAAGVILPLQEPEDRIAWIVLDGQVVQGERVCGPGALLYPEALLAGPSSWVSSPPWRARSEVRALALRERDFRDVCEGDTDLGEKLRESLNALIAEQSARLLDSVGSQPPPPPSMGVDARAGDSRVHARGSKPPVDQRGFARDGASESPLVLALAALAEEQSEPEISIEPWLEHAIADAANESERDPSHPNERTREQPQPKGRR